jgi:hypothetical protein
VALKNEWNRSGLGGYDPILRIIEKAILLFTRLLPVATIGYMM